MKEQDPRDFPNIIFDFGGVIINIDVQQTIDAFQKLIPENSFNIQQRVESSEVFKDLEKGMMEEHTFLDKFNELMQTDLEWEQFEPAWNSMIGDLPKKRLDLLEKIAESHRIFLLSNTNSIHLRRVNQVVRETIDSDSIDHYFEKAFYSNRIGMRKPDREIYDFVVKDQELDPDETIFLDDNVHNLAGAKEAGLSVCHISENRGIIDLF